MKKENADKIIENIENKKEHLEELFQEDRYEELVEDMVNSYRREQLEKVFENFNDKELINQVINEVVFLEEQLNYLKRLPMIKVNPKNKSQSKMTESAKLYQKFLQQYNNDIKILISYARKQEFTEEENDAFTSFIMRWSNND